MLEKFVELISGGEQHESRRLFYARAEIEQTAGLDLLHKNGMRLIFEAVPCPGGARARHFDEGSGDGPPDAGR